MPINCSTLVADYLNWLKSRITVSDINGVCEITTPFLDRHNDRLQIYVRREGDRLVLSDDGYIISDLEMSGCGLDTPHRRELLQTMLNGYGVHQKDDELVIEASEANFPQKKHALLQSMLAVNDMFMTANARVANLFVDDVARFLEENDIRYSPTVEFTGKSGLVQKFDFIIPKSRREPERILRAINHPTRDNAISLMFAWSDIRDVRPSSAHVYAVLNDSGQNMNEEILGAFSQYDVRTMRWSQREQFVRELAA